MAWPHQYKKHLKACCPTCRRSPTTQKPKTTKPAARQCLRVSRFLRRSKRPFQDSTPAPAIFPPLVPWLYIVRYRVIAIARPRPGSAHDSGNHPAVTHRPGKKPPGPWITASLVLASDGPRSLGDFSCAGHCTIFPVFSIVPMLTVYQTARSVRLISHIWFTINDDSFLQSARSCYPSDTAQWFYPLSAQ